MKSKEKILEMKNTLKKLNKTAHIIIKQQNIVHPKYLLNMKHQAIEDKKNEPHLIHDMADQLSVVDTDDIKPKIQLKITRPSIKPLEIDYTLYSCTIP